MEALLTKTLISGVLPFTPFKKKYAPFKSYILPFNCRCKCQNRLFFLHNQSFFNILGLIRDIMNAEFTPTKI